MVNPPRDETVMIRKLLEKFDSVGDASLEAGLTTSPSPSTTTTRTVVFGGRRVEGSTIDRCESGLVDPVNLIWVGVWSDLDSPWLGKVGDDDGWWLTMVAVIERSGADDLYLCINLDPELNSHGKTLASWPEANHWTQKTAIRLGYNPLNGLNYQSSLWPGLAQLKGKELETTLDLDSADWLKAEDRGQEISTPLGVISELGPGYFVIRIQGMEHTTCELQVVYYNLSRNRAEVPILDALQDFALDLAAMSGARIGPVSNPQKGVKVDPLHCRCYVGPAPERDHPGYLVAVDRSVEEVHPQISSRRGRVSSSLARTRRLDSHHHLHQASVIVADVSRPRQSSLGHPSPKPDHSNLGHNPDRATTIFTTKVPPAPRAHEICGRSICEATGGRTEAAKTTVRRESLLFQPQLPSSTTTHRRPFSPPTFPSQGEYRSGHTPSQARLTDPFVPERDHPGYLVTVDRTAEEVHPQISSHRGRVSPSPAWTRRLDSHHHLHQASVIVADVSRPRQSSLGHSSPEPDHSNLGHNLDRATTISTTKVPPAPRAHEICEETREICGRSVRRREEEQRRRRLL
ncbi:hypothetical protein AKJ16_DCAP13265 [Drosera capensis]